MLIIRIILIPPQKGRVTIHHDQSIYPISFKVINIKPKYFIDNRNSSFQQLGFYAQEVKSVINEASYPIGNTDYLGINDRAILATTVKAIQEQQAIIETQQQTITDLETTIQALITRIENLENK